MNIIVWDLNEEAMQAVAKELRAKGATAFTYRVDVSKRDRVYEVAKQVSPSTWLFGALVVTVLGNGGRDSGRRLTPMAPIPTPTHPKNR